MKVFLLDGKDMTSLDAAYDVISRELSLPEYFGRNLDALYDCLTELSSEGTVIFVNTAILEENLPEKADAILDCFRDAAMEVGFSLREKR